MDFSEAERSGFIAAFIEFWTLRSDSRTHDELSAAAGRLLRGCEEHFRAGVTRVARINGAVPPDLKDAFTERALGLLRCSSSEEFQRCASLIVRGSNLGWSGGCAQLTHQCSSSLREQWTCKYGTLYRILQMLKRQCTGSCIAL